jgi:recombination protein RecT
MAVQNSLTKSTQTKRTGITAYLNSEKIMDNIKQALGETNKQRFITGVISAVNNNAMLQECTNQSILSGALLGETLKLSPSPQLGHYYLVPFNDKEKGKVAQFQLGYKGYIQLAIRSGQYKKLNVLAIKQGELEYFDPLNEEIKISLMVDKWDEREELETIGYYAMFELVNGFKKAIYWSKKQMENHALKYSPGFKKDREKGWNYTFWSKDFDGMAYKTMLRQLISKWGIMSIDLQTAFEHDMSYTDDSGNIKYTEADVDEPTIIEMEQPEETHSEITESSEKDTQTTSAKNALFGN